MPKVLLHQVKSDACWLIWQTSEEEALFPERFLSTALPDWRDLQSEHLAKRKTEWVGSRLATQALCATMGINFQGIGKEASGKPFLIGSSAEISLTHCNPFAVAYISFSQEVGIDIEQPKEKMLRLAPRFMNDEELAFADHRLEIISKHWSAKEALYKIYAQRGLIFRDELLIKMQQTPTKGIIKKNNQIIEYPLEFYSFKEYFICYNI